MRVSVICPTFNRSKYLCQAIESFKIQNYPEKEMIIIDDGSTDNTKAVVEKYLSDEIKYYCQKNAGQAHAQNVGIQMSTGDLICTLDDDDLLYDENSLSLRAEILKNHEVVWTSAVDIRENGEVCASHPCESFNAHEAFKRDRIFINSLMWHKSVHSKVGYFDEELSSNEDWDFKVRLLIHCNYTYKDIYTVKHRIHPQMRSNTHRQSGVLQENEVKFKEKLKYKYAGIL